MDLNLHLDKYSDDTYKVKLQYIIENDVKDILDTKGYFICNYRSKFIITINHIEKVYKHDEYYDETIIEDLKNRLELFREKYVEIKHPKTKKETIILEF